jgi:hypothetical protein
LTEKPPKIIGVGRRLITHVAPKLENSLFFSLLARSVVPGSGARDTVCMPATGGGDCCSGIPASALLSGRFLSPSRSTGQRGVAVNP